MLPTDGHLPYRQSFKRIRFRSLCTIFLPLTQSKLANANTPAYYTVVCGNNDTLVALHKDRRHTIREHIANVIDRSMLKITTYGSYTFYVPAAQVINKLRIHFCFFNRPHTTPHPGLPITRHQGFVSVSNTSESKQKDNAQCRLPTPQWCELRRKRGCGERRRHVATAVGRFPWVTGHRQCAAQVQVDHRFHILYKHE